MTIAPLPSPLYAGTGVTTQVTFANPVPGQPQSSWPAVDPTEVTLTWVGGTGADPVVWTYLGTGSIVRVSTGVYSAELPTDDAPGRWLIQWQGTGACAVVSTAGFPVTPPPL